MKRLYHLHTPKTGGHWVDSTIISPLENALKKVNIELISDHAGWSHVTDQTYIISSWRDPAKRTISHYFHSKNKFNLDNSPTSEYDLIKWISDNKFIIDYQSKSLLYMPQENKVPYFYANDINFANIKPEKSAVRERVDRINIFIKTMTNIEGNAIINKIVKDLSLEKKLIDSTIEINFNSNDNSKIFWENASSKLKDYLYEINPIDSEIYFDNSNNWSSR